MWIRIYRLESRVRVEVRVRIRLACGFESTAIEEEKGVTKLLKIESCGFRICGALNRTSPWERIGINHVFHGSVAREA